jgi:hypothetical protein
MYGIHSVAKLIPRRDVAACVAQRAAAEAARRNMTSDGGTDCHAQD